VLDAVAQPHDGVAEVVGQRSLDRPPAAHDLAEGGVPDRVDADLEADVGGLGEPLRQRDVVELELAAVRRPVGVGRLEGRGVGAQRAVEEDVAAGLPQVALGRLAEDVVLAARQPGLESIEFTLGNREERADLVAAIRLLLGYGVLVRVAGDEESYVSAGGDALYDVDRRVLATMLATEHSPAVVAARLGEEPPIERIEAALQGPPPAYTEDEANRRLRQAVSRRLLCDPVVYYDELPESERSYLTSGQRVSVTRRLAEATGLVPELRAEGIALVDPDDQLTDVRMPEQGTDGHAALLLAEHLATQGATDLATLRDLVKRLAKEHAAYWRKTTREPGAENALVAQALDRLAGLGLVRVHGTGADAVAEPLPALRRFAMTAPTIRERSAR
jgi:uncharacterized protein (TIGR02678 family)